MAEIAAPDRTDPKVHRPPNEAFNECGWKSAESEATGGIGAKAPGPRDQTLAVDATDPLMEEPRDLSRTAANVIDWDQLADLLSDYVEGLEQAAIETTTAQDRARYAQHLAAAASMFRAVHRRSLGGLKRVVSDERRSFGWGYLSGDAGSKSESAFDRLATLVESLDDAG